MMSFREYVERRKRSYTTIGCFVEAVKRDSELLGATSLDEFQLCLAKRGISAQQIACDLWTSYEGKLRANN